MFGLRTFVRPRCKNCGVPSKKVKKIKRFYLNPNRYLAKRMSILSFWEFKDEVRKMKLQWQKEAAKWFGATGIREYLC